MIPSIRTILAVVIFVAVVPVTQAQEDKVIRSLTPEAAEALLKEFKIDFVKSSAKKGDEHYYDFKREGFKVRLTYFSATEVMVDCVFRGIPIDKVNAWNASTRFSRASYHKDGSGEFTLLEYSLDLTGGVTVGAVKQFIVRFDDELKKYDRHVTSSSATEDVVLAEVSNEKIENILKTQGTSFNKKLNNAGVMMFDFEMNGHSMRLYNFGGKDLMIDTHFKKISLEDVNQYNLNRKFIRAVNYKGKDVEYTALECNLDCEGGVTEGIIRNFINSFGEDAVHFTEYRKKLTEQKK
jgi:hypothetical protein